MSLLFLCYVVGPLGDNYGYYGPDLTDDDVDGARDVLDVEWVSDDDDDDTGSDDADAQERDVDGKWLVATPHVTSSITAKSAKLVCRHCNVCNLCCVYLFNFTAHVQPINKEIV